MAPFADAVGFVDGDAAELALGVDFEEVAPEGVHGAVFGGDVEELGAWVAALEVLDDAFAGGLFGGAVDCVDGYAGCAEGGDLVVLGCVSSELVD